MMNPGRVIFSFNNRVRAGEGGCGLLCISVFVRQPQILFIGFFRVPCQHFRRFGFDCVLRAHDMG